MALLHNPVSGDEPPSYEEPARCVCGRAIEADQGYCSRACAVDDYAGMVNEALESARQRRSA